MTITDDGQKPLEGISGAAWRAKNHSGIWTEGTKSDKLGRATVYLHPKSPQYVGAHDWRGEYELKADHTLNLEPGQVVNDLRVIMTRQGE